MCRNAQNPRLRYFEAFGETKPLPAWWQDPRCEVAAWVLRRWIKEGLSMESALKRGCEGSMEARWHTAFGEAKSLEAWSRDPRCEVSYGTLKKRFRKGIPLEAALIKGSPEGPTTTRSYEAFGESKSLRAWAEDPRCGLDLAALQASVYRMPLEAALVFTGRERLRKHSAFGERKRLGGWLADPRCTISAGILKARMSGGEPFESAITRNAP